MTYLKKKKNKLLKVILFVALKVYFFEHLLIIQRWLYCFYYDINWNSLFQIIYVFQLFYFTW